ncbi:zinc-ribbon domain-containing protein [Lentibacillus sp. L22]|uniref:zinc-ribbon domain-containing protein n=1 Tax=Lentibacillus sp. L22 TaxID=3163028 RepID=UPI00346630CC
MYCPNCGMKTDPDENFCSSCGANLANGSDASIPATADLSGTNKKEGTVFVVLGWVFFAISILFIPILFGAGAFIMGYLVRKHGKETHGIILMVLSVAGAILGMLIGMSVS